MIEQTLERIAIALEKIAETPSVAQITAPMGTTEAPTPEADTPITTTPAPPVQEPKAPSYTASQLGLMCRQLADQGKLPVIQSIFQNYEITALDQLPQDKYGDFANQLILQGAKL